MRTYAAVAVVVVGLGCQKHDDAGTSVAVGSATTQNDVAAPKVEVGLSLVDPGAEPRKPLRYHLAKGSVHSFEMAIDVDMDTPGARGAMPTMRMIGDVAVDSVSSTGEMQIAITTHDIHAADRPGSPMTAAAMQQYLSALEGFTMRGKLNAVGAISDIQIDAKNATKPMLDQLGPMTQNIKQLAMPFPDAPLGVGARWDLTNKAEQGGLAVTTTTHVTLTKISGDTIGFRTDVSVAAPSQVAQQPGLEIHIDNIRGGGSGDGTIDLASFALTGHQVSLLEGDLTAGSARGQMKLRSELTITPVER